MLAGSCWTSWGRSHWILFGRTSRRSSTTTPATPSSPPQTRSASESSGTISRTSSWRPRRTTGSCLRYRIYWVALVPQGSLYTDWYLSRIHIRSIRNRVNFLCPIVVGYFEEKNLFITIQYIHKWTTCRHYKSIIHCYLLCIENIKRNNVIPYIIYEMRYIYLKYMPSGAIDWAIG